jgi:hypothetical protein
MKLTESKLRKLIKEELLKEGGDIGTLENARYHINELIRDTISAVNSENFSGDDEGHSQAKEITKDLKMLRKKVDGIFKKYNQNEKLWFRSVET